MRIGIDCLILGKQNTGIGRYLDNLVAELVIAHPDDEFVLFASDESVEEKFGQAKNVSIVHLGASSPTQRRLVQQTTLGLIANRRRLDVYHGPDFYLPPFLKTPAVVTIHDLVYRLYPETFIPGKRLFARAFVPASIRRADHCIAVSDSTRSDLLRHEEVSEGEVSVTHLGVRHDVYYRRSSEEIARVVGKYGIRRPYVLFVGMIEPRKNLDTVVKAFDAVVRGHISGHSRENSGEDSGKSSVEHTRENIRRQTLGHSLVIAGSRGTAYDELCRLIAKRGLGERITFAGFVADNDLPALYSGASAFIFPSLYEGFGIPPLEAIACGVPVITSTASSLPEVVGNAGLLVDPLDETALAQAMARVLSDTDLAERLSHEGLERAKQFTWSETARLTYEVYHRLSRAALEI